ncbi:WD40 repeat-like protein [Coniochaeta ligniaria NRRL 30616]|uniref:WD40 repeat-like protein n=1 Tax=Coniochaeta ligniaria NRRL 30616 TaxID=1408157 RepID=A0A1J7JTI9_9PEZI|nr:WD40 repeat-like protein [Coniochaeta ligniaria NRRL 30616]
MSSPGQRPPGAFPSAEDDVEDFELYMQAVRALDSEDPDEEEEEDEDDDEDEEEEDPDYEDEEQDEDGEEEEDDDDALEILFNAGEDGRVSIAGTGGSIFGAGMMTAGRLLRIFTTGQDASRFIAALGDDGDEDLAQWVRRRGRRQALDPDRFPKVPSKEGRKLMDSGVFGHVEAVDTVTKTRRQRKALARRVLERELGLGDGVARRANLGLMKQGMIPSNEPEKIIHYPAPVCCGQFSDDGNFFYSCVKDLRVRMYDTSDPYNWKHYKTADYPFGQWTLTDADLSPDNKWLAYSSLQSHVAFAPTDPGDKGEPYTLDLASPNGGLTGWRRGGNFAIYSVRFSGDGTKLVAGTGADSIVVYDIESRTVLNNIVGHENDVNAVCFADKGSPHILYSGSDDCTIKVWDTRSMGDGREGAAFVGHVEGITYIDSKGDGRYILSNGKDQSMKLWDLRMAMSTNRFEAVDASRCTRQRNYEYDYRWEDYDDYQWFPHPHDNSTVTFRGHKVQRTLIRCHFSPPGSSDSRYVYSGSQDGFVYVWNLDATLAAKIDVKAATMGKSMANRRYRVHRNMTSRREPWTTLVRDVGWHPNLPMLVASSWTGATMDGGAATVHGFNESVSDEGMPPMGISVNEKMEEDPDINFDDDLFDDAF